MTDIELLSLEQSSFMEDSNIKYENGLKHLFISNDEIGKICEDKEYLGQFPNLVHLEINCDFNILNGLSYLSKLKKLMICNEKITVVSLGECYQNLEVLQLDCKNLTKINDLGLCSELIELKINGNSVKIEGLSELKKLKKLKISLDNIDTIEGLSTLTNLEYLSLIGYRIIKIEDLSILSIESSDNIEIKLNV